MLRTCFNHASFITVLKNTKNDQIVEAKHADIVGHFKTFFSGSQCITADPIDPDIW